MVSDVRVDRDRYAVGFGIKNNKPDHFGQLRGEDGRNWVWVSRCRGSPLDIVPVVEIYFSKMNFNQLNEEQKKVIFFYQEIIHNKPSGMPLTYSRLLSEFRYDLSRLDVTKFPILQPSEWGLHSWRRFAATLAKLNGLPNDLIMYLGKWRSDSFLAYFAFTSDDNIEIQSRLLDAHRADFNLPPRLPPRTSAVAGSSRSDAINIKAPTTSRRRSKHRAKGYASTSRK